jgi:hypothetical protein
MFAYRNDTIKVGLIKKDKPLVKPKKIFLSGSQDKLKEYEYLIKNYNEIRVNEIIKEVNKDLVKISPESELLDVVKLRDVKRKSKETIYDQEANIAVKRKEIAASFYQNKKVTEQMEKTYQTIWEYFTHLGITKTTGGGINFLRLVRGITSLMPGEFSNPDGSTAPIVHLDGVNIMFPGSLVAASAGVGGSDGVQMLRRLPMADVDEILINRSGAGVGFGGVGGVIKIYLKKGNHKYYQQPGVDLYENLVLLTGFDRAKKYYKPLYNIYNESSLKWTEIDWKNSLETDENGEVFIKTPTNKFSNDFQFVINGFSENGLLFHDIYKTDEGDF